MNLSTSEAQKFLATLEEMPEDYAELKEHLLQIAYPETIINLTPHTVTVVDDELNTVRFFEAAPTVSRVRVVMSPENEFDIAGIPVVGTGGLNYIPAEKPNTYYLVSSRAAFALPDDRHDFLVPDGMMKDAQGRVVGCKRLVRV